MLLAFSLLASADAELAAAMSLYKQGEFAAALGALDAIVSEDERTQRDVHLYRGFAFFALEREDQASRDWELALDLDPDYTLPPLTHPKLREAFASLRAKHRVVPRILHTPPARFEGELSFFIRKLRRACAPMLRYRLHGEPSYRALALELRDGAWGARLFLPQTPNEQALEYFVEVLCDGEISGRLRAEDAPFVVSVPEAKTVVEATPWFRRWWVWTLIGAGVATAGVTATLVLTRPTTGSAHVALEF